MANDDIGHFCTGRGFFLESNSTKSIPQTKAKQEQAISVLWETSHGDFSITFLFHLLLSIKLCIFETFMLNLNNIYKLCLFWACVDILILKPV